MPKVVRPRIAIPFAHSGDPEYSERVMPQYAGAVERAGGEAVPVSLSLSPQEITRLATHCAGVLLPGSRADVNPEKYDAPRDPRTAAADPLRDNVDELLLQDSFNMRKPLLAICFGVQILNVWRNGTLRQHVEGGPVRHFGKDIPEHRAAIEPASRLAHIVGATELTVNSSHHQALERRGGGLRVVATCPDDGVIEAVEGTAPDHFVLGVQWHPERMTDAASAAIFQAFVDAAREWKRRIVTDYETISNTRV